MARHGLSKRPSTSRASSTQPGSAWLPPGLHSPLHRNPGEAAAVSTSPSCWERGFDRVNEREKRGSWAECAPSPRLMSDRDPQFPGGSLFGTGLEEVTREQKPSELAPSRGHSVSRGLRLAQRDISSHDYVPFFANSAFTNHWRRNQSGTLSPHILGSAAVRLG